MPTDGSRGRGPGLGLVLPTWTTTTLRWTEVLAVAREAAAIGLDSLWVTDHLLLGSTNAELRERAGGAVAPGAVDEPEGYMECFTVLSALAVAVPDLELGALVACTGYRNPALLAKMADTLDEVCGGRFTLGLGAGDSQGEHLAFGYPCDHPVGRFEEALHVIRTLLSEGQMDFEGSYYHVRECQLLPRGPRPAGPPILIGTLSPRRRMRRLVARYADFWNAWLAYTDASVESARTQTRLIDEACREHGRDPGTLGRTAAVRVLLPGSGYRPAPGERPLAGSPRQMADTLRAYGEEGIGHVQVALTLGGVEGVRAFAPVVEALRAG